MDKPRKTPPVVVAALYRFTPLTRFADLRQPLKAFCDAHGVKGTLLLAAEGINGTVAGSRAGIDALLAQLRGEPELAALEHKESCAGVMPFHRMKVRLKREIVTMGVEGIDPTLSVGTYVAPQDWNALIADPDTVLVDTRNAYEVAVGTFAGAIDPATESFREFPQWLEARAGQWKNRKLAMFCTGGIRCEKATAYAKGLGFKEVYHLKGGILKYLETVPQAESLWNGECFVFDERVGVGHGLKQGELTPCRACRHPLTSQDRASPLFSEGVSCPHCHDKRTDADRARYAERQRQVERAELRGTKHIGDAG